MKLTNGEIFNARAPLDTLLQQKVPLKVSYKLAEMAEKLNAQVAIINKVRQGLFETYGEKNPYNPMQMHIPPMVQKRDAKGKVIQRADGNPVMEDNPKLPKFLAEVEELMSIEVELVIEPVVLPEKVTITCEKCGNIIERALGIEPANLMLLKNFIKVA